MLSGDGASVDVFDIVSPRRELLALGAMVVAFKYGSVVFAASGDSVGSRSKMFSGELPCEGAGVVLLKNRLSSVGLVALGAMVVTFRNGSVAFIDVSGPSEDGTAVLTTPGAVVLLSSVGTAVVSANEGLVVLSTGVGRTFEEESVALGASVGAAVACVAPPEVGAVVVVERDGCGVPKPPILGGGVLPAVGATVSSGVAGPEVLSSDEGGVVPAASVGRAVFVGSSAALGTPVGAVGSWAVSPTDVGAVVDIESVGGTV